MKYAVIVLLVLAVVVVNGMMEMSFTRGYSNGYTQGYDKGLHQGYEDGRAFMVQTEQDVLMQCTAWWFNNSGRSAVTAINEYCDRRIK